MSNPPPPGSHPPPPPRPLPRQPIPAQQHVVQVVAKPSGFSRAVGFVFGIGLFVIVFGVGIIAGISAMLAAGSSDGFVVPYEYRAGSNTTVAIIPVRGVIDGYQAEFVRAAVDHTLADKSIKAVVLRVDSPGGGVTASDQIWYQVGRLKDAGLPVVASYGGIAASGGYYVSCHADHIVAETTCITGSIGVIAQVMTLENLMDKVGIEPVTIVASHSPDKDVANNVFRSWGEQDVERVRRMVDSSYAIFRTRVAEGRKAVITDAARLEELADGSVFTSAEALENGLIDSIGYLDDAIAHAEQAVGARTGSATVIQVDEAPTLFPTGPFATAQDGRQAASLVDADAIRRTINDLGSPRVMYLMR